LMLNERRRKRKKQKKRGLRQRPRKRLISWPKSRQRLKPRKKQMKKHGGKLKLKRPG